jgi:Lrp/AsnC family transcriptional regulator, leucine-responsive regulatory protein
MAESLDPTDWAILNELQTDARMALTELGRRVNLSATPTRSNRPQWSSITSTQLRQRA